MSEKSFEKLERFLSHAGKDTTAYMVVGCPGSGKSYVCEKLKDRFCYVHHDGFIGHINQPEKYVEAILEAAEGADKPLLIEAPFSISQIKGPLEEAGITVECVYIQEKPGVIEGRYETREKKQIPKGHITRQGTYLKRAKESGAFIGTSDEVLEHLKEKGRL